MSKGGGGGAMQGGYGQQQGGFGQQQGGFGSQSGGIVADNYQGYGQQGGYGQPRVPVGQGGMYSRMGAQSSMGGKGGRSPSGFGQQGGYRGGFGGMGGYGQQRGYRGGFGGFGGMQAPPPRSGLGGYGQQRGGFGGFSPAPNYGQIGRGAKGGMGNMGGNQRQPYRAPYMPTVETSSEPPQTGGGFPIGAGVSSDPSTPVDENTRRRMESGMNGNNMGGRNYTDPITGDEMYQPPMPTVPEGTMQAMVMPPPINTATGEQGYSTFPSSAPQNDNSYQANIDFMNEMAQKNAQVGSDGQSVSPSFSYDQATGQYVRDSSAFGLTGDAALTRYSPEEFQSEFGRTLGKMPSQGGGDQGPIGTGIPASDVPAFDPSYNSGVAGGMQRYGGSYSNPNMGRGIKGGIQGPPRGRDVAGHDDLRARQARNLTAVPQPPLADLRGRGIVGDMRQGKGSGDGADFLAPSISTALMRPQQISEVAQPLINEADMPPLRHVEMSRPQRAQGIASMLQPSPYRPQFLSNPPRQLRQIQQMPRQQVGRGRYNGR